MSKKYPMIDYSKINASGHTLYLSEKPCNIQFMKNYQGGPDDDYCIDDFLDFMVDEKIETIVVLLTDAQIRNFYDENLVKLYRDEGFNVIHYPIRDFSTPKNFSTYHKLVGDISKALDRGNVLIHCSAGWGRTGLVASGVAVYKGHNPHKAIALIRKVRPGSVETKQQEKFINYYHQWKNFNEGLVSVFKL